MRGGVVPELCDQRMLLQDRLDDRPLRAAASAVNQTKLAQSGLVRGAYVLVNDGRDVAWREGVEIEVRFDGDAVRIPRFGHAGFTYSATTDVVMPPRAVKAPVTVIRRGWHTATRSSRMRFVTAS